jgi:hypothetical protein
MCFGVNWVRGELRRRESDLSEKTRTSCPEGVQMGHPLSVVIQRLLGKDGGRLLPDFVQVDVEQQYVDAGFA